LETSDAKQRDAAFLISQLGSENDINISLKPAKHAYLYQSQERYMDIRKMNMIFLPSA
jgi:hypothetical protein